MVNLIVLDGSETLTASLSKALEAEFAVAEDASGAVHEKTPLRLLRGRLPDVGEPSIVICGPDFSGVLPEGEPPSGVGVVFSDYAASARALSAWQMPVISCGMAGADTMTFSSFTSDSAVLCLQRGIPTLDGLLVEPGEMPLKLARPYGRCTLMAAASVFLLTGRWDRLRELPL